MKFAIIGVLSFLLGLAVPPTLNNVLDTKAKANEFYLLGLKKDLAQFFKECGQYPSQEFGLKALVDPKLEKCNANPILDMVPVNPWHKDFKYFREGEDYYLFSEGTPEIVTSKN